MRPGGLGRRRPSAFPHLTPCRAWCRHPKSPDPETALAAAATPRSRQLSVRSKSQASHEASASQRAARTRPRGASPSFSISAAEPAGAARTFAVCETRDSATQTRASRTSPHEEPSPTLESTAGDAPKRSDFLFGPIQLQSELGMAIQAALEFTAEQRVTRSPLDVAAMQRMHLGGDEGSDGENAAEDLEVRSLSLSEDGPVIARALSERERKTAAPDPIAMLTHGQHHVGDLDRAEQRGEKQNGSSDLSAAGTESAPLEVHAESHEQSLCRNLLPILQPIFEKTAELSGSEPAGAAAPTYQQRLGSSRSGVRVKKVRPVRSSRDGGSSLTLADLKTAGRSDPIANLASVGLVASRSELSFGSEYSAFTSVSSPSSQSGSKDSTPLHGRGLTGVASMPSLQQYRGARSIG